MERGFFITGLEKSPLTSAITTPASLKRNALFALRKRYCFIFGQATPVAKKRSFSFTLLEIVVAIGIFAVAISLLLDQRNQSLEKSYMATQLVKAQHIVDEILAVYRLQPFSKEPMELNKDYAPFEVAVDVHEESINIIPEDWRVEFLSEEQEKKKRIILRVSVDVGYGSYLSDKITEHLKVSTLIRHIELEKDKDT